MIRSGNDRLFGYRSYFLNRSNCQSVGIIYSNTNPMITTKEYYDLIIDNTNLFFIITIGSSSVVYFWKKAKKNSLGLIYNACDDDCQPIYEYINVDSIALDTTKMNLFNRILTSKGKQNGVLIKGTTMYLPDPFTYDELILDSFPIDLLQCHCKINTFSRDLFVLETTSDNGIVIELHIGRSCYINIGGVFSDCECELTVLKAW